MARSEPFAILFREIVSDHLRFLELKHHSAIRHAVDKQLRHTPNVATRNRKPLRQPILEAFWELRCGPDNRFRVFYNVDLERHEVQVLGVGIKEKNHLRIGGEEMQTWT